MYGLLWYVHARVYELPWQCDDQYISQGRFLELSPEKPLLTWTVVLHIYYGRIGNKIEEKAGMGERSQTEWFWTTKNDSKNNLALCLTRLPI